MRGLLISIILILTHQYLHAQKPFTLITNDSNSARSMAQRMKEGSNFQLSKYNSADLREYLSQAPEEYTEGGRLPLYLPMPDGSEKVFMVTQSPNMMAAISAKYPSIKSYIGHARSNPNVMMRLSLGPNGVHAAIHGEEGVIYMDPIEDQVDLNMTYYVKDEVINNDMAHLGCGTFHDTEKLNSGLSNIELASNNNHDARNENIPLKIYRLAIACTGEFGQRRNSKEELLADINTSVNRLNMIFENELSIRMILIDRNDEIIYLDPQSDPYIIPPNTGTGYFLLERNTQIVNNTIGVNSYDLGHIYHVGCTDVGGVAYLGSICGERKAGGVTCHASTNLDYVTVSIAAHEMGHQLGAPHTFNNCGGNESPGNGFEPGSGSTIMSYAGLCGSNNVQGGNDDYYHVGTLEHIYRTTRELTSCGETVDVGNHRPVATIERNDGFHIPISTPFLLTGDGSDQDNNSLTYSWEQYNSGPISPLGTPLNGAPAFRVFYPSENKTRIFPKESSLLSNFEQITEVLPTYSRDLDFKFVVRDNNDGAGFAAWDHLSFKATDQAGPFLVQFPNSDSDDMTIGQEIEVRWDVANTDKAPVNCEHVDIYLSINGYVNSDVASDELILLAKSTPNDGSQNIIMPNVVSNQARILVRASDNIFFDISNAYFETKQPETASIYFDLSTQNLDFCSDIKEITLSTSGLAGFDDNINLSVENLPEGATYEFSNPTPGIDQEVMLTINLTEVQVSGAYQFDVVATNQSTESFRRTINALNVGVDFTGFQYTGPENGSKGQSLLPTFNWEENVNAVEYLFELSTSPSFEESSIIDRKTTTKNNYTSGTILENSVVYYWRVKAQNSCADSGFPEIYGFSTESLSCATYAANNLPKNITQSGTVTILAEIPVTTPGNIADVNVTKLRGTHERNRDLVMSLISPSMDTVLLFSRKCGNQQNFNCGFDDQSPNAFSCPLNSQQVYRPTEELAKMNGKPLEGTWLLQCRDSQAGNGGKLEEVEIELCSNVSLDPPVLVNNNTLEIPPATRNTILNTVLLSTDANNNDSEIIYTVVALPQNGTLTLYLNPVSIGTQWTQADINNGAVRYEHDGSATDSDSFRFDVKDGEGGWIEISQFSIAIDEEFSTSTDDGSISEMISIYPNPAIDILHINHDIPGRATMELIDAQGRTVTSRKLNSTNTFETSNYASGLYLVRVSTDQEIFVKRIIIQ